MIRAGFGVSDITPPVGAAIPGGFAPRTSTGVLTPLQTRACVIRREADAVALVGVDAVSLRFDTVAEARKRISEACAISARNVVVAASHTHTGGPANDVLGTDSDPEYCEHLASAVAAAVIAADAACGPAELAAASACCPGWAFNRRFSMRSGGEATNPGKGNAEMLDPAGPVDPAIGVIVCRRPDGAPAGIVANYTCHCTVIGGTAFSGDYPAFWEGALQELTGHHVPLVFLNGACGDINQLDFRNTAVRESGPEWAERMGQALAASTTRCLESAEYRRDAVVSAAHGSVPTWYRRPTDMELHAAGELVASDAPWDSAKWRARDLLLLAEDQGEMESVTCPVDVIRVGDAVVAAAPWQPFCEFGLRIKEASPFEATLVAAFANGMLGYVPTPRAFKGGGYEPTLCRGSKLHPGAGDAIVAETVRLIRALT